MLGAPNNPLDPVVAELVSNARYLTKEHKEQLAPLCQTKDKEFASLHKQVEKQLQMLERLQTLALGSSDIAEVKGVMSAGKDLINTLVKFNEKIDAESRQIHIENAIVATLDAIGNADLKAEFLRILAENLAKKA